MRYQIEGRDNGGQWSTQQVGGSDAENSFATRAEADAKCAELATAWECDADRLRVVEIEQ